MPVTIKGIPPYREFINPAAGIPFIIPSTLDVIETALVLAVDVDVKNPTEAFIAATLSTSTDFLNLINDKFTKPRVRVWIDGAEVSKDLEGKVELVFPENAGAFFNLSLGGDAYNPFANPDVSSDKDVIIKSVFEGPSGTQFETPLFKGLTKTILLNVDSVDILISGLDMTRAVAGDDSKLDMEIYAVDSFEEILLPDSVTQVTTTLIINDQVENPITGVFLEDDLERAVNYFIGGSFAGKVITLGSPLPSVQNVAVRYFEGDTTVVTTTRLKKSAIVRRIVDLSKISSVRFPPRADEDIESFAYLYANKELPLDIIRKIVVPQCWRVEYDELGELECRRSEVKSTPDWIFDKSLIDLNSFFAEKDSSKVKNIQPVKGVIKEFQTLVNPGASGTPDTIHPYAETSEPSALIQTESEQEAQQDDVLLLRTGYDLGGGVVWPAAPALSFHDIDFTAELSFSVSGRFREGSLEVRPTKLDGVSLTLSDGTILAGGLFGGNWVYYEVGDWSANITHTETGADITITIRRLLKGTTNTGFWTKYDIPALDVAFDIYGEELTSTAEWVEEGQDPIPPEYNSTYFQVGVNVTDETSGVLYGKKKGRTFRSPFIETLTQCTRVAEQMIRQSNKVMKLSFSIPLNPMVKRGQTVRVINAARSIDVKDVVEEVRHLFDLKSGEATTFISMSALEYDFTSSLTENQ